MKFVDDDDDDDEGCHDSRKKVCKKANVTKLTENISTLRMSDLVASLGCSLSY